MRFVIGAQLDFVGVQADPSIVGETTANLYVQTTLKTQVPSGGFLKIILPSTNEVAIKQGSLTCSITGDVTQTGLTCTASGLSITVTTKATISAFATIQVNVQNAFQTPSSSQETSSFTFQSLAADGNTILDILNAGITLIVSPDTFTSTTITQIDSTVVGSTTSVLVSLVNQNKILAGSRLRLIFPKWNPAASSSQIVPIVANPTSVTCTQRTNVNSNVKCTFDAATDSLNIIDGFPSGLNAGTQIQFVISNLRNPLSFAPVSIQVQSLNSGGTGIIDNGSIKFAPSIPATISATTAKTSADLTTVQEYSNFRLEFQNPVPLNAGTIVTVVFPSQFSFEQKLAAVQGFGLFGSIKNLAYQADSSSLSVKLTSTAIDSYKQSGIAAILTFQQVKNPSVVRASDSFSIYLTDINGYQIAQATTGITYTPTSGSISGVSVEMAEKSINQMGSFILRFQPLHILTTSSVLQVQLPTNLDVSCTGLKVSGGLSISITCSEGANNLFTFENLFSTQYTYSSSNFPTLTFANVKNPGSAQQIKSLSISTFEKIVVVGGPQNFAVDAYSDSSIVLYTTTASQFKSQSIEVSTNETYTDATFTITLVQDNQIPQNGILVIVIPSEITIVSSAKCTGITNLPTSLTCSQSGNNLTITNGFSSGSKSENSTLKFSLSGLRTPLTTQTSSTFQVYSKDSNSQFIDQVQSLLTVTMLVGKKITTMSALSDSNIVADSATLSITVKPTMPLKNGDIMYFTIPSSITLPLKSALTCTGADALKATTLGCTTNGQILIVTVNLNTSPSTPNSSVLTVRVKTILNPKSTKPTAEISLIVRDSKDYEIGQSRTGTGAIIVVGTPASITTGTLTPLDYRQKAYTAMTIKFATSNPIPAGGYLQVEFDQRYFSVTKDSSFKCTSSLVKNVEVTCEFTRDSVFLVKDIFPKDLSSSQQIDFTINNVNINYETKTTATPSWKVTSMTSDGYMIDKIDNVLTLSFPCNVPCLSCLSNNPNYCLSCNTLTGSTILYNNKCLNQCPDGLFYNQDKFQCDTCGTTCKTCNPYNPNECLSCNINSPLYPYLLGNTCTDQCPVGFFSNNKTAACEQCQSPCATCSGSSTSCLSCDESNGFKLKYNDKCYQTCPTGTFADDNNQCVKCDSSCLTCQSSATFCSSCPSNKLLSLYENNCVDTCPFGQTILNSGKKQCDTCDPKCLTCEKSTTFCTSCAQSLNLIEKTGVCTGECSSDKKTVGFNGICTPCDTKCATCVNNPTSCLTCVTSEFLYDYSCLSQCPSGFLPDLNRQCVIDGLRCPFGQQVNPQGTACVLKAQICENGFRLNQAKDRCIPGPNYFAPFPIIFCSFGLSLVVLFSWYKHRETLVVTNIVCAISIFETIGLLMLVALTYEMGVYSSFALSLIGLIFLYGSNAFFALVFLKQVSGGDSAFKYWGLTYTNTQNATVALGSMLNFKLYRIIYGKLFGRDQFNAAFDEPEHFFKPFTFVSVFSLVTTMIPILVACIIGFAYIEFGYQAQMICVEMFIIELVLLGLMIYEKIKLKSYALKQQKYLKVEPKYLDNSSLNVMSSLIDENTNNYSMMKPQSLQTAQNNQTSLYTSTNTAQDIRKNKTALTTASDKIDAHNYLSMTQNAISHDQQKHKYESAEFKEYFERRRMLERLISNIYNKNPTTKNKTDTVDLITKLQEDEMLKIQNRVCRSFRDLREFDDDFVDQGAGDPELQNFISAPVSPREKELLHNPFFLGRVELFKKAVRLRRDQYDNCYAEAKPTHYFPMRDTKLISVKVQTNLLELLAIDDMIRAKTNNFRHHDSSEEEYVEENLNGDYASGLINNVLDTLKDHQFTKQRRRLPRSRLQQIPNFDLSDITGDFEIDNEGNCLIIRGKDGKLNDREGRRVNKRGYLIDNEGNIVTAGRNMMIFRVDELDSDDEIPAPFCFEKKKESLFKIEGIQTYNQKTKKKNIMDQEDEIEREYRKLREKNASHQSSVDSLMGENPSKYNKKNQRRVMPGDEDGFLSKIVQPMQAKTKNELLKQGTQQAAKLNQADNDNLLEGLINHQSAKKVSPLRNNQTSSRQQNLRQQTMTSDSGIITREGSPSRQFNQQPRQMTKNATGDIVSNSFNKPPMSIGGYETGINENYDSEATGPQDLFFSGFGQQNNFQFGTGQSRMHGNSGLARPNFHSISNTRNPNTTGGRLQQQSTMSQDGLNFTMAKDRASKLNMLKDTLGSTQEDIALLKQLQKFEQSMMGRQSVQQEVSTSKSTLAKKNLQKVYGKVFDQQRLIAQDTISSNTGMSFHKPSRPPRPQVQSLFEEDNQYRSNKKLSGTGMSILQNMGNTGDSRIKNLENIYIKSVNQERRTVSQLNKQRHQQQIMRNQNSAWDLDHGFSTGGAGNGGTGLTNHRPLQHSMVETGIESSDQDELRMRQQLDKMQAIIDKGQQMTNANTKNIKVPRANKNLFNGGWV